MKKLIAISMLSIASITLFGQINLEHTFTSNYQGISWFITDTKGIMYYTSDTIANQITFYNEDYSVYKNVIIDRPVGYTMLIVLASEQLFNTNNSIEFICAFWKGFLSKIKIYDENATLIRDFGSYNYMAYPYLVSKGTKNKLVIKANTKNPSLQLIDEVYSLPGSLPTNISKSKYLNISKAYPNPSNTNICIPFTLKNGRSSVMRIYDLYGQLMDQKPIDSSFTQILLNVGSYPSGIYFYEYDGITDKFVVQ
jgi:hypothetical protein